MFEIAGIPAGPAMTIEAAHAPIHPDDLPDFMAMAKQAIATGEAARSSIAGSGPTAESAGSIST